MVTRIILCYRQKNRLWLRVRDDPQASACAFVSDDLHSSVPTRFLSSSSCSSSGLVCPASGIVFPVIIHNAYSFHLFVITAMVSLFGRFLPVYIADKVALLIPVSFAIVEMAPWFGCFQSIAFFNLFPISLSNFSFDISIAFAILVSIAT